jgi:hypothetical protein
MAEAHAAEDPLARLRASAAARAAAPPDASLDIIAQFGLRPMANAAVKAPPQPPLLERSSIWLRGPACDTQLWRDPAFELTRLLAAPPQPPPAMAPFDLSALQAAFTFRPSVVELAEVRRGARCAGAGRRAPR